jgi:hypothetical protein
MTEDQARQVLLLQAHETTAAVNPHWSADDRAWATQQALATVGDQATPEQFVSARAALALPRLLPRDQAAQRWLARRGWHPAWVVLALVLGFFFGLGVDQLGSPQRVNLLAPAVWAVVAWNAVVYVALLLPGHAGTLRAWIAGWGLARAPGSLANPGWLWAELALPLSLQRWAVLLHAAAAALGIGLIAGLYLRGLVLDYRAGWESTFLDAPTVQSLLGALLWPASTLTGIAMPAVAPLQLAPGVAAQASAAPWIHLYGATLLLAVVLPRALLALWAAARARWQARHFSLPLATPYFEALAPLMQPRLPRALRLLWAAPASAPEPPLQLLGTPVPFPLTEPLLLLQSDEGDQLVLHPAPQGELDAATQPQAPPPWWQPWKMLRDPARQLLARLQASTEAVLVLQAAGSRPPAWLPALARPVVVLHDGPVQGDGDLLSLQSLADGWLPQGRLLRALAHALPGDARLLRLQHSWQRRQQAHLDEGAALLARSLARTAGTRVPLVDNGLMARKADGEAARLALAETLQTQWQETMAQLSAWAGQQSRGGAMVVSTQAAAPSAVLHKKLGEGRAAMLGGVLTGALAGLKADVLSGGLTMGAGMVAGGVLGALGGAGMARGLNVVRGADSNFAAWDDGAMAQITHALLQQHLAVGHGLDDAAAQAALQPALATTEPAFAALWRSRHRGSEPPGERETLARELQPLLLATVKRALGGP